MSERIATYSEFWDFYLREHSQPMTWGLHFAGTLIGIAVLVWLIVSGRWYWFPVCLVIGYAFAWFAHFVIEKNRPATFKYPLWSFISDYKMLFLMLTGRLGRELTRVFGS